MKKRVVITGMGVVAPNGVGIEPLELHSMVRNQRAIARGFRTASQKHRTTQVQLFHRISVKT